MQLCIGVLALQGGFFLHKKHLEALGVTYQEVRKPSDLEKTQGLILPGGESSTLLKLIEWSDLRHALKQYLFEKPIWGTCAGAILLAETVTHPTQSSFQVLPFTIKRNGYGRQWESQTEIIKGYFVSYIRAPQITYVGSGIRILHEREGFPTWIETSRVMVTTFHPEVNPHTPSPWHRDFLKKITS